MDIGERQKRLSLQAEQQPDHRFDDLCSLIGREDWLMLAHDYVDGNAGSETAGCDGINLRAFDEDLEGNLRGLIDHVRWYMQESLKYFWIIEGDISSYLDAINHRKLMKLLGRRIKDGHLLDLIWSFLR